jgi:diguanylate cyclase (GGDEF)-like protein/hemerythrin-like metal-binding protein/PAS domain S-box-containing protein
MNLDLQTLAYVLGLSCLLQVIALIGQYRSNQARAGLGWWTLGSAALALGFIANALREVPGLGPYAIVANNALFLAGTALNYVGVLRFFQRKDPLGRLALLVGLAVLLLAWFTFSSDNMAVRRVFLSAAIAAIAFLTARALWVNKAPPIASSVNFLTLVFSVFGAFFLARASTPFLGGPVEGFFSASPLQTLTYLMAFAGGILWNFGFIILVNQRLNFENLEAKEHFEAIFNMSPDAVLITRASDGCVVDLNQGFTALTGFARAEVVGQLSQNLAFWNHAEARPRLLELLSRQGSFQNLELEFRHQNGSQLTGLLSAIPIALEGQPHVLTVARDITDWKQAQEALRESNQFLAEIIENNGALIFVKDLDGRYQLVNRKWETVTGFARADVLGRTDVELFPGEAGLNFRRMDLNVVRLGKVVEEEEELLDPGGKRYFLSIKFPLRNPDGSQRGLCGMSTEITRRKRDEQRIQDLAAQLQIERDYAQARALTDGLTQLANRRHFDDTLSNEFYRLKRSGGPLSLILLDVDQFKKFNDRYGHLAGDDCLKRVAHTLKTVVARASDLAARYGGEEFAVILPETDQAGAGTMAERIRRSIEELAIPHEDNPPAGCITISLGVVTRTAPELVAPDKLINLADEALYRAKQTGRNRIELSVSALEAMTGAADLVRLVWREAAESGNPTIDTQHQALFYESNALLSAILVGASKEACTLLMEKLLAEVVNHFRDEEDIIRAAGYPDAEQHALCHTELVARAVALAEKFHRDELAIGELFSFLAYEVVAQHLYREDRKFFPYLGSPPAS